MSATPPPRSPKDSNFKVFIVGAGLGGLLLAILFERAGIDYDIFEKSTTLKNTGGTVFLPPSILPALEQLGLLDEIKRISVPLNEYDVFKESPDGVNIPLLGTIEISENKSL